METTGVAINKQHLNTTNPEYACTQAGNGCTAMQHVGRKYHVGYSGGNYVPTCDKGCRLLSQFQKMAGN
jgi:hypothetical protein